MEVRDTLVEGRTDDSRRQNPRQSRCTTCNRVFSRKEHLIRHQRTRLCTLVPQEWIICNYCHSLIKDVILDTEEAPFQCTTCGKRFRRQDVLRRHSKDQCNNRTTRQSAGSKQRTAKACNNCRLQKVKCNGTIPCQRCSTSAISCLYSGNTSSALNQCSDELHPTINPIVTTGNLLSPISAQPALVSASGQANTFTPISPASFDSTFGAAGTTNADYRTPLVPIQQFSSAPEVDISSSLAPTESGIFSNNETSLDLDFLDFQPDLDKIYDPFFLNSDLILPFPPSEFSNFDFQDIQNTSLTLPQNVNHAALDTATTRDPASAYSSLVAPTWLCNLRPNIQFHDSEIINYFLNKFMFHVAPIMPTFEDFGNTANVLPDLILAMAAVGGLFCPIEGGFRISLAMHTDARRLAISRAFSSDELGIKHAINLAQTFICLEVFGLCSGDPRTFECTEAQHALLLQTVDDYSLTTVDPAYTGLELDIRLRLIESLSVLESYHVLLLQRPAHLCTTSVISNFVGSAGFSQHSDSVEALEDCSRLLDSLMNPHTALHSPSTSLSPIFCLTLLAAISGNVSNGGSSMLSVSWKKDLLELGLHRWFSACRMSSGGNLSIMTLFHLIFINIRTDLELIHKFARWKVHPSDSGNSYLVEFQAWQQSEDCEIATLHAKQLLDTVKKSAVFAFQSHPRSGTTTPSRPQYQSQTHQRKLVEAPHLATGVYMATLVLWTAAIAKTKPDLVFGRSVLENGILVLSCFNVRVATKLGNVLRCLNNSCED